jgi:hypothetical protein
MNLPVIISLILNLLLAGFIGYQNFYKQEVLPTNQIFKSNYPLALELTNSFAVQQLDISGLLIQSTDTVLIVSGLDKKNHTLPLSSTVTITSSNAEDKTKEPKKLTLEEFKKMPVGTSLIIGVGYDSPNPVLKVKYISIIEQ